MADGTRAVILDGKPVRGAAAVFGAVSVVLFVPEDLLLPRAAPACAAAVPRPGGLQRRARLSTARPARSRRCSRAATPCCDAGRVAAAACSTPTTRSWRARGRASCCAGARSSADLAPAHGGRSSGRCTATCRSSCATAATPPVDAAAGRGGGAGGAARGSARAPRARRAAAVHGLRPADRRPRRSACRAAWRASTRRRGSCARWCWRSSSPSSRNVEPRRGDAPVLLLDDVPSELDPERRRFLFEMIGRSPARRYLGDRSGGRSAAARREDFLIAAGAAEASAEARASAQRESLRSPSIATDGVRSAWIKRWFSFTAWS